MSKMRWLAIAVAASLGLATWPTTTASAATFEQTMPDVGLRKCVTDNLKLDAGAQPSASQLGNITQLMCVGKRIANLQGIDSLTGLTQLYLTSNQVSDLTPLSKLTGLTNLLLPGNKVSDVSPLATLTKLKTLNISNNPIQSISALRPLTAMTDLDVSQRFGKNGYHEMTSLDGVQAMTKLTRLNVNNAAITDLEPLRGLTELSILAISNNKVESLEPISGATKLTSLIAPNNKITDVAPLAKRATQSQSDSTKTLVIDISKNAVTDVSPLKDGRFSFMGLKARDQVVSLKKVPANLAVTVPVVRDLQGNVVTPTPPTGVSVTDGMVTYPAPGDYVWTFSVRDTLSEYFAGKITQPVGEVVADPANIPDSGLRACLAEAAGLAAEATPTVDDVSGITQADCSNRNITTLTGLELLVNATSIDLSDNPLAATTWDVLSGLRKVTDLDLSATGVSRLPVLSNLTSLTTLRLDNNHLADLSGLGTMKLTTLSATGQQLNLPSANGGVDVKAPTVRLPDGSSVPASAPQNSTATASGAMFKLAGTYQWPFTTLDGSFTGSFAQQVTTDAVDMSVHDAAAACLAAGNVWVVVERDTGLQQGGCATQFGDGLEALKSAGFTPSGTQFVAAINGYPTSTSGDGWWSYWHASQPKITTQLDFDWTFSQLGATNYHPQPGTIEAWRFQPSLNDRLEPSWDGIVPGIGTAGPEAPRLELPSIGVGDPEYPSNDDSAAKPQEDGPQARDLATNGPETNGPSSPGKRPSRLPATGSSQSAALLGALALLAGGLTVASRVKRGRG